MVSYADRHNTRPCVFTSRSPGCEHLPPPVRYMREDRRLGVAMPQRLLNQSNVRAALWRCGMLSSPLLAPFQERGLGGLLIARMHRAPTLI
jgi:hypothetical protein